MNKTTKIIVELGLGIVIVGLGIWLYLSMMEPVKFDNEFNKRRAACAEKLKVIRTLEEAYKLTYNCYCGDFDTLINRLMNEDSMRVVSKVTNRDIIPEDVDIDMMPELEALKKGYITRVEVYMNPIAKLREDGKLKVADADGNLRELSDEEVKDICYVPYPKDKKYKFQLDAAQIEKNGFTVPVFECKVDLIDLLADMDHQLVINKISELESINRYPGWKVGDMTQSITDGNFE
ncbi:MAG: hypothetical protein KBT45_02255 [Bacteroidales bacterium]|nr:hypothetical protein [Candidatus Colimorpha pelethequi]